jgi:indolepyruvate ferredoxin oxidoreductase
VIINERVCEGCGDCGKKSGCLSVEPIDTEFGRKTRVNELTCNKDYSCLEGDCPSFITVIDPKDGGRRPEVGWPEVELPEAELRPGCDDVRVRVVGIGGTGVLTVSQVLEWAMLLDGHHANGVLQTGLSQKAGPVVSDLHLATTPVEQSVNFSGGAVDVLLGCDVLGAATGQNLRVADPDRTVAVVSDSVVPTGKMVVDVDTPAPSSEAARAAIDAVTRAPENQYLDAQRIAERLIGDAAPANVVVLGAAWQLGLLPVSLGALEDAFRLNGVAVERNLAALAWGRAWVVSPERVMAALRDEPSEPELPPAARSLIDSVTREPGELRRILEVRVPDLIGWGGQRAATRYVATVADVHAVESERLPGSTRLTEAVACGLHKLIAYKDEYEVARLHLAALGDLSRANVAFHLHPPILRALGMKKKRKFGRGVVPVLRALRRARVLRGTPLDPFGHTQIRRIERVLPDEYLALVDIALGELEADTLELAVEIAELPELVRGYEQIKLAGVERFRAGAEDLRARLAHAPSE